MIETRLFNGPYIECSRLIYKEREIEKGFDFHRCSNKECIQHKVNYPEFHKFCFICGSKFTSFKDKKVIKVNRYDENVVDVLIRLCKQYAYVMWYEKIEEVWLFPLEYEVDIGYGITVIDSVVGNPDVPDSLIDSLQEYYNRVQIKNDIVVLKKDY